MNPRLASNAAKARAIVFCVSVAHAEFMTGWLKRAGLPAACVVGSTPGEERRRAPQRLMSGELCALVTVDLYNEGVDLPMVDTLLLLRPMQSPVLFQQQIGRGLRLAPGKDSCQVLDFVRNGFGSLPPGCHMHLQRQTREQGLQSPYELITQNGRRLKTELQTSADPKVSGGWT